MSMGKKFTDIAKFSADQARKHLESLRWSTGPVCPHCGSVTIYILKHKPDSKHPVRKCVYKCKDCRKQFTVTVGTLFEGNHVPLNKWLIAVSLMCSSKKGISAHQLHRMLDVTYKTAWFMAPRIRFAMQQPALKEKLKGIVEVDETYVSGKPRKTQKDMMSSKKFKRGRGTKKTPVVALVQRDGVVKSQVMTRLTGKNLKEFIKERDGYKGLNPYCSSKNPDDLTIHHIDYNKKNCDPSNLITVCRSCNSAANSDREWHTSWYQALMHMRYGYKY